MRVSEVFSRLMGRPRRWKASPPIDAPPDADPLVHDLDEGRTVPVASSGRVVRDHEVSASYPGVVRRATPVLSLVPEEDVSETTLNVFEADNVALTTCYMPIDTGRGYLFINQTYEGMVGFWNPRPTLTDDAYDFRSDAAILVARKAVIIGGPIEGSYYHWVLNWLSRLVILKLLRPDIYEDRGVSILLDVRANQPPFIDFLRGSGIDPSRFVWIDHAKDYLIERAVLVSFGNHRATHPEIVRALGRQFGAMAAASTLETPKRLWISRQALPQNRRRIHNMDDIDPILGRYGFTQVALEQLPVADQIRMFSGAEVVAGVHGAGFTNTVFSPADCKIISLESDLNLRLKVSYFYSTLAQACGQPYRHLKVKRAPLPPDVPRVTANFHNQDILVDPVALERLLNDFVGLPQQG